MYRRSELVDDLIRHEGAYKRGDRHIPYEDSVGKTTIGYGRNLTDRGISDDEAALLLEHDIAQAELDCVTLIHAFLGLDPTRQDALINMMFNLGRTRLAKFTRFLAAVEAHDWPLAATEMLDSKWAAQVGSRATYLAAMIKDGKRPA